MNSKINIKSYQIRAARSVLGIGVRDVGETLSVSGAAVSLWENTNNNEDIKTSEMNIILLIKFFEQRDVFFPDVYSISLNPSLRTMTNDMLTKFQLRAARAILNISQQDLAQKIGVSTQIITRAEGLNNNTFIRPKKPEMILQIRSWLENQDIYFPNDLTLSLTH